MIDINKNKYSLPKVVKHYANYSSALQPPEKTIFELLKPQLHQMKMLDIGVGCGRTTTFFAPLVKEYIGIDFSAEMIEICQSKFKDFIPTAQFEECDVRNLTRFETCYFDFVLFSFNGLDNISHEERLDVLKEIKRICTPNAYFCFSSHNLQFLPKFFKIRFRLHPSKFYKSLIGRKKLVIQNKDQIKQIAHADYLTIYDDVYDFGLHTYYIRPSYQIEQLNLVGFSNVRIFSLEGGLELKTQVKLNASLDSWNYYLSKLIK